ncbi:hypothetical protein EX30DRAFT_338911 [Ascodesmis nigricans]|uniref:Eukaryotic mitochondrial regulator protein-domain-containing protein n=1 Tax=Ascodesmis nigricans TaxID=341454 RepID=A0A4S2N533_9PEZI|nr:hypothetical protein EX30DRAFT_338911 [Ascodesmis nigricans]
MPPLPRRLPVALPSRRAFTTSRPLLKKPPAPAEDNSSEEGGRLTQQGVRAELHKEAQRRLVADYEKWVETAGQNFKYPLFNEPNYAGSYDPITWERKQLMGAQDVPFPANRHFRVHPVLSDEFREAIWESVVEKGRSVRQTSMMFGVSLERVAAVVRLKAVEKKWVEKEKPLATFLTKCLASMMPVTHLPSHITDNASKDSKDSNKPARASRNHENIQELLVHPFSTAQAFIPASESHRFTREDAGKHFGLPATDDAVPHPSLIQLARDQNAKMDQRELVARQAERDRLEVEKKEEGERKKKEIAEKSGTVVENGRWQWRLQEAETGKVGIRYGVPHQDRKRGQYKVPRKVVVP